MTNGLKLTLLGETTIKLNGKSAGGLASRKAEAMLIYLVSTQRPYSRELLADFFWDDRPPEQAMANLRSLLSGLRRKFKPYLEITRQTIAFREETPHWLDTAEFHALAESDQVADWEQAIALYRADFLVGFDIRDSRGFEEWVSLERERHQRTAVHLLRRLVQHHLDTQLYEKGIRYAARLLAISPLSEWAHRQMMLLLARNDQRAEAVRQYQTCCDVLVEELGIDPSPETTTLYERIRAAVDIRRHNLPVATTPFVGRLEELSQIQAQLVRPSCRLLTLMGPGGIGKTRLALELARTAVGTTLNGVYFVPLAAVPAPEFIVPAIAEAVGFTFSGAAPPKTQLLAYLEAKEMLLLLDNFEHLQKGSQLLAEMIQALPDVKLLVTSRERLNLQTEWTFEVGPLPLPNGRTEATVDSLQLFTQLAQRAQADFALTPKNQTDVAKICRLVAGVPLGIELASGWVRQLSCAEIASELAQDMDFLQTRAGDVPDRHRSLQAVFDHSWALLTEDEQQVLAQLTLFRGGFTREAARQVTQTSFWTLTTLTDKSLLHREANGRFEMLELVRQFAAERLASWPELASIAHARYAQYYLGLLHAEEKHWYTEQRQQAIDQLSPEIENVRAAWRWAVAALENLGAPDEANKALGYIDQALVSLFFLYESRGWFQEGAAAFGWAMAALEEMDASSDPHLLYGRLLVRYGRFATFLGQFEKAEKVLNQALDHVQPSNNAKEISLCHSYLAIVLGFQGNYQQAIAAAETALALTSEISYKPGLAFARNLRGTLAHRQGEYEAAQKHYAASLSLRRELGDQYGTAVALNNLGNLAHAQQDFAAARTYYEESQLMFKAINHQPGRAATLGNAGVVAMRLGELAESRRLHEDCLILKQELGNRRSIAISLINLGEVTHLLEDIDASRRAFHEALRITQAIQAQPLALDALAGLASLLATDAQRPLAIRLLQLAHQHPASTRETKEKAAQQLSKMDVAIEPLELPDLAEVITEVLRPYT